jgi:hypothetical protein
MICLIEEIIFFINKINVNKNDCNIVNGEEFGPTFSFPQTCHATNNF